MNAFDIAAWKSSWTQQHLEVIRTGDLDQIEILEKIIRADLRQKLREYENKEIAAIKRI